MPNWCYWVLGHNGFKYLIQVKLITGRSYQIRAQMAHIGCPLMEMSIRWCRPKFTSIWLLFSTFIAADHPTLKERMSNLPYPKVTGYWVGRVFQNQHQILCNRLFCARWEFHDQPNPPGEIQQRREVVWCDGLLPLSLPTANLYHGNSFIDTATCNKLPKPRTFIFWMV